MPTVTGYPSSGAYIGVPGNLFVTYAESTLVVTGTVRTLQYLFIYRGI
jgi:hypothetical protein